MVPPGSRVADIGTRSRLSGRVPAPKTRSVRSVHGSRPARAARCRRRAKTPRRFGVGAIGCSFCCQTACTDITPDAASRPSSCAGMGGDLIVRILEASPAWICDPRYTAHFAAAERRAGAAALAGGTRLSRLQREALVQDGQLSVYRSDGAAERRQSCTLTPGAAVCFAAAAAEGGALLPHSIWRRLRERPRRDQYRALQKADEPRRSSRYYADRACGNRRNEEAV